MSRKVRYFGAGVMFLWLVIVIFFMILAGRLDLEIFFVLWLIGILIIVELVDPAFCRPHYLLYLRYVIAVGVVIFGTIVAGKVLEILGT
jgi:hypothetical protein